MPETKEVQETKPAAEKKKAEKTPTKKSAGGPSVASMARALALKHTGLKPVEADYRTVPFVPSGSTIMDNLIGGSPTKDGKGRICPGYPRRKITELYGAESSGKTTAALAAVVECQKNGGVVGYLDFEHALMDTYVKNVGVDLSTDKFLRYQPDTLEQGIALLYIFIRSGVDLVIVDSVAAMIPKAELEKSVEDAERVGALAAPLTRFLKQIVIWLSKYPDPKEQPQKGCSVIFINQTRSKIGGAGHGDEDQTPGGKALKFFSALRIKLTRIRSETIKKKDPNTGKEKTFPYGNVTVAKMIKNKLDSKQGQDGIIFIRYGYGIDDLYSIIETAVTQKVVKKEGAWLTYENERWQGRENFRKYLLENPKTAELIKKKVSEAIIAGALEASADDDDDEISSELAGLDAGDDETFEKDILPAEGETVVEAVE